RFVAPLLEATPHEIGELAPGMGGIVGEPHMRLISITSKIVFEIANHGRTAARLWGLDSEVKVISSEREFAPRFQLPGEGGRYAEPAHDDVILPSRNSRVERYFQIELSVFNSVDAKHIAEQARKVFRALEIH